MYPYTAHPLGDKAILLQFTSLEGEELLTYIHSITAKLFSLMLDGVIDIVPAFTSIAVYYDPIKYNYKDLLTKLDHIMDKPLKQHSQETRLVTIPVCYDETFGLDIVDVARQHELSVEQLIDKHTKNIYTVAIMGFLPGFPYLIGLDKQLWTQRKSTPRTHVQKGAVAIGGSYTGIYPVSSPGGWNIIGHTPLSLFNNQKEEPFLLVPGDKIRFEAITKEAFLAWGDK